MYKVQEANGMGVEDSRMDFSYPFGVASDAGEEANGMDVEDSRMENENTIKAFE